MSKTPLCDPYVWENPKVLLYTGFTLKQHKDGPCASEMVNHILFLYLVATAIGGGTTLAFGSLTGLLVSFALATAYSIPTILLLLSTKRMAEAFQNSEIKPLEVIRGAAITKDQVENTPTPSWTGEKAVAIYDVIGTGSGAPAGPMTLPTARNPFMNILVDEFKYNPQRPGAVSVNDPSIRVELDDFFRTSFYADPTDVFGRAQSQREFITMPSTSIPNDRESYQNWLYKIPGKTCKEGGRESCLPGTDGGQLPWLNADK
jgi:hypothetical protein